MSTSQTRAPSPSGVTLFMNGKTFELSFTGEEKFFSELERAASRGHSPADALAFLATLSAIHCNPHHFDLSAENEARWRELFG